MCTWPYFFLPADKVVWVRRIRVNLFWKDVFVSVRIKEKKRQHLFHKTESSALMTHVEIGIVPLSVEVRLY